MKEITNKEKREEAEKQLDQVKGAMNLRTLDAETQELLRTLHMKLITKLNKWVAGTIFTSVGKQYCTFCGTACWETGNCDDTLNQFRP